MPLFLVAATAAMAVRDQAAVVAVALEGFQRITFPQEQGAMAALEDLGSAAAVAVHQAVSFPNLFLLLLFQIFQETEAMAATLVVVAAAAPRIMIKRYLLPLEVMEDMEVAVAAVAVDMAYTTLLLKEAQVATEDLLVAAAVVVVAASAPMQLPINFPLTLLEREEMGALEALAPVVAEAERA
jgi:hypothetical protein